MPVVAIVGRPNVGKSTLFNRLTGRMTGRGRALVDNTPGLTRDRRVGDGRIGSVAFTVFDTAGFEEAAVDSLAGRMTDQARRAAEDADLALMLIDARAGVTPVDRQFADWLRRLDKPVLLAANKAEGRAGESGFLEAFELGLGEPLALSAEHGEGLGELATALADAFAALEAGTEDTLEGEDDPAEDEDTGRPIRLAIVGRPNVGKSTLLNSLLGEERVLTGPEPGITRDAVAVPWQFGDRAIELVDTAGMRRKARIDEKIEKLAVGDTLTTIRHTEVAVLLLDALAGLERQDLTIADHVVDEGRALVIALNKWDAVNDPNAVLRAVRDRMEISLPQVRGVPLVTISALKQRKLDRLIEAAVGAHRVWNRRISTGRLNRWLEAAVGAHPPPLVAGRRLKLRYMTQLKARPPTFAVWANKPDDMPDAYKRYLLNGLRETFEFPGTPLRLTLRKGDNPYADKG